MPFGRLERGAPARPMAEINMTPLIDVMLVLLVIFIIAAPLITGRLALDLPQAEGARGGGPAPALRVALDAQGRLYLDELPATPAQLRAAAAAAARSDPATELQLRADRAVPYGEVAALIGLVQQAGLSRIAFVADPLPEPEAR